MRLSAPALLVFGIASCKPGNHSNQQSSPSLIPTPTPAPASTPFPPGTYAEALRGAAIRLQGRLPLSSEMSLVLASGEPAYDTLIDEYLTTSYQPTASGSPVPNLLQQQLLGFYQSTLLMGGTTLVCTSGSCAVPSSTNQTLYNQDEVPALAVNVWLSGAPVAQLLSANYCVDPATFQPYPEGTIVDGTPADAYGCPTDGAPLSARAGVISQKPALWYYGDPSTLDFRLISVIQQIFDCGIFPDPADDDSTLALSSKYQGTLAGSSTCSTCHGSLNARRLVMLPYDEFGVAHPLGTAAGDRTIISVEELGVNGGEDYCGNSLLQPVPSGTPYPVIDPSSYDCQDNGQAPAIYHGQTVANLAAFGGAIAAQPEFLSCMITRHYDFLLGKGVGQLGLQAAGGVPPPPMNAYTELKYQYVYQQNGYSTRELFRAVLKGSEYLSSQP